MSADSNASDAQSRNDEPSFRRSNAVSAAPSTRTKLFSLQSDIDPSNLFIQVCTYTLEAILITFRRHALASALPIFACFGAGSLYGWSAYLPAVRAAFAVSYMQASMVFSAAIACFTLGVLIGPRLLTKLSDSSRTAYTSAFGLLCIVVACASSAFPVFLLAYGMGFGFASGMLYNHSLTVVSGSRSSTWLVPATVASFGLGGAVFGSLTAWLGVTGWGIWSVLPAAICLAFVAILAAAGKNKQDRLPSNGPPPALPTAFQARPTIILWAIFACGSFSGLVTLGFAAQLVSRGDAVTVQFGLAVIVAAMGNTLGRLLAAPITFVLNPSTAIALALAVSSVSLCALIMLEGQAVSAAAIFFIALAYGRVAAAMPLLVKEQTGGAEFAQVFGWVFTGWGLAGLVGPWLAGFLLDTTGGFQAVLTTCLLVTLVGLFVISRLSGGVGSGGSPSG